MAVLNVNIDHVATIRQARRTDEPDPVWAAVECELAGANGITVHLRQDRRHINDRDVWTLKETVASKLNLEMSMAEPIVKIAEQVVPDQVTLVPENRQELTTEGGLDCVKYKARLRKSSSGCTRRASWSVRSSRRSWSRSPPRPRPAATPSSCTPARTRTPRPTGP